MHDFSRLSKILGFNENKTKDSIELEKQYLFFPKKKCYSYELNSLSGKYDFFFNILPIGFITNIEEMYTEDNGLNNSIIISKSLEYVEDKNRAPKIVPKKLCKDALCEDFLIWASFLLPF